MVAECEGAAAGRDKEGCAWYDSTWCNVDLFYSQLSQASRPPPSATHPEGKGNVDEETADYFMFLFARERFI